MSKVEQLEAELKEFIINTLALEDIMAEDIGSADPLFGDGLGLDSVDALELGVALTKQYGVSLDANSNEVREHFASVQSLASFITAQKGQ